MTELGRKWMLVALGAALVAPALMAQGVTTAAVYGTVTRADSTGIEQAVVTVTNTSNGERWSRRTGVGGRYVIEYLSLGGPYIVEARALGFAPASRSSVVLSLGERGRTDLVLLPVAAPLVGITIKAANDALANAGRTGPAQTISESLISRLPVRARDFAQLVYLSPQAVLTPSGGVSIAGQSDRLNGFQIDGATNLDLTGFAGGEGFGTPGAPSGVRTLSVEALSELQILTAPFDVRYGTFAGGLVNAVTKSGSNAWRGSFSSYFENRRLTGKDSAGLRAQDFGTSEFALAVGGPLVRDRAAFFLDVGLQRDVIPQSAPGIGRDTVGGADSAGIGVRYASAVRFQDILRDRYGVNAGSFASAPTRQPSGNVFAKVTLYPSLNNRVEVSHNFAHGSPTEPGYRAPYDQYSLTSNGSTSPSTVNATRLTWTSARENGTSNDLILAYLRVRERCSARLHLPEVLVVVDESQLAAGDAAFCTVNYSDQDVLELTNNLSLSRGGHRFTFGTHTELIRTSRLTRAQPLGQWTFAGLDELDAGTPDAFVRSLSNPLTPAGTRPSFGINQPGFYVQDQWAMTSALTVTAGLRVDVPFFTSTPTPSALLASALGIDNTRTPSGNAQWAPRLGFSYDLDGRGFVRGGIGLFAGRPAYHWLASASKSGGGGDATLVCEGPDVPVFTLDVTTLPSACGGSAPSVPTSEIVFFNPRFQFPRNLRVSLGTDLRLPGGVVGTIDALLVHGVNQFYLDDANLVRLGTASGEAGRVLYGTLDPGTGEATTNRRSSALGPAIEVRNSHGDRSFVLTTQIQKRFARGTELGAAYTYTNSRDRMSAPGDLAPTNLGAVNILDGTWNDRRLAPSLYSVPHKVTLTAAVDLPRQLRVAVLYNGQSGAPYSYRLVGDANADGITFQGANIGNDPVYVPRDASDISLADPAQWDALDTFIRSEPCLAAQRGRLMRRNSCRNHGIKIVNARLSKVVSTVRGQSVELIADLFNALNFIKGEWGVRRSINTIRLIELVGYDAVNQRGVYDVLANNIDRNVRDDEATRWRVQLGARYAF